MKYEDPSKGEVIYSDDKIFGETGSEDEGEKKPLLKTKQRELNWLTVAELKQLVSKPEVVKWTDVSATDRPLTPPPPHMLSQYDPHPGPLECEM